MTEPTPRQVLYAIVAGAFWAVVATLVIGSAVAGVSPAWWTQLMAVLLVGSLLWGVANWRRTAPLLITSIGLFLFWTLGTLIVA